MAVTLLRYLDVDGPHNVVLDRASTSIGRSPDRDVVLQDALVSRQHAVITRDGDTWTVSDPISTHGTYLNGARIRQAILKPGDVLQFGSLNGKRLRFLVQQEGEANDSPEQNSLHDFLTSMQARRDPSTGAGPAADRAPACWAGSSPDAATSAPSTVAPCNIVRRFKSLRVIFDLPVSRRVLGC